MVTLGKASCDEFAMGSANQHCAYGPCTNPWDETRIPGGSSGGSAAAVAAGLAPAATGTDTGGSVRQPAAMCGITGIKPTYGRVSRWGMVAYASSLDQAGAMARTAQDCAWLLNAMAGFDPKDATSLERPSEDFSRLFDQPLAQSTDSQPLAGLRVGLPKQFFGPGLSSEVRTVVDRAIEQLQALGAVALEVDLPRTELSIPAYYVIAPAEASSNLSRFDGVRYGHRTQHASDLETLYRRSRTEGFGLEVQRRILIGTFVLSHGYYDAYYLQAQKVRRLIAQDFQTAFQSCDVILGPVAPTAAWLIAQMDSQDPMTEYLADIYTLGASLAGLPAMSLPCGFVATDAPSARRLPVGLQLIGPQFQEAQLLAVAHAYQQATDWHYQTPKKES
jgi:aspartyl-tRNA(Asn)/glutamyl-tRNA(Gln) amidotransferase subunit A